MGMQRGRAMMKYLSIPVLILGLFLTFLLDLALYHEDSRMSRDVLTATASHKLNRFYDYLNRYMTAAEVIGSMIDEKNGTIDGMGDMAGLMKINPSIRFISLVPREGEALSFQGNRWLGSGRSMLEGPLKEEADEARRLGEPVIADSLVLDHEREYLAVLRPVYLERREGRLFWGYVLILGNQNSILQSAGITSGEDGEKNYRLLREKEGAEQVVAEQGQVGDDAPSASASIGKERWVLLLEPHRGWFNLGAFFFATLCGVMASFFVSFLWRRNRALKVIGDTDSLTGVYNRKGGDEAVAAYLHEHPESPAMVIALDIDNFKLINDVYGHGAGDAALKTLVADMRRLFGAETLITRNGGDEFILFHPFQNREEVEKKMTFFTENPHIIQVDGKNVSFYSSMGSAEYPRQGREYGKLCVRADFALYTVKLNGKAGWRRFDDTIAENKQRTQFGFNLSELSNSMPGAMLVCRATEDQEILFANRGMIDLLECDNFEDFMHYTGGTFFSILHEGEERAMKKEFHRQLDEKENKNHTDFLTFRVITKKGRVITVEDIGRKVNNPFYGELYYIFMYDKAEKEGRQRG